MDAAVAWVNKRSANGKLQGTWNFAGLQAGAGIVNAESVEELSQICSEFPLGPFAETEIYPLMDAAVFFKQQKQIIETMMQQMPMKAGVR